MPRRLYYLIAILLVVSLASSFTGCNEPGQGGDVITEGNTGIKSFWTYDSNVIGGGGKAMVNLFGGNLLVQFVDVSFPGRGLPVEIRRTYNSQTTYEGSFGKGWFSLLDTHLEFQADKIVLTDAYGGKYDFTNPVQGDTETTYTSPPGRNTVFKKLANGTFTEKKKNGSTYFFDQSGKLIKLQHRNVNNCLQFVYAGGNNPTEIKEASGRTTSIQYSGGHISRITDPEGRITKYRYQQNLLTRVTDPENNNTSFEYHSNSLLSSVTNQRRINYYFTYDEKNRLTSFKDPLYEVNYQYTAGQTIVTDSYGHNLTYDLNDFGNNTEFTDTLGGHTTLQWDDNMNLTQLTNAKGQTINYTYDARGNCLTEANSVSTTGYAYDEFNNLTTVVDGNGHTSEFTYAPSADDPDGVLTSVSLPSGRTSHFTYDQYDQPLTVTNAKGNTTTYAYGPNGNVIQVTDAAGGSTVMTYNTVGEALTVRDALNRTASFTYDKTGQMLSVRTPSGATTSYRYDDNGNRTRVTDALGRNMNYTYDNDDRMMTVRDELGGTTHYTYQNGLLASTKDPSGFTTTMSYDGNDRMIGRSSRITNESFTYDAIGNVLTKKTGLGTIQYSYDGINRLTQVKIPKRTVTYTYDSDNKRTGAIITDSSGAGAVNDFRTYYEYDLDDRLIIKQKRLNGTLFENETLEYDANDNLIRLAEVIRKGLPPVPNTVTSDQRNFSFIYTYDELDRQTGVTNSNNDIFTAAYDAVGNLTAINYPDGTTSILQYDSENRVIGVSNDHPLGMSAKINYQYTYDAVGNYTSFTKYPPIPYTPGAKRYQYDRLNRLTYDEGENTRFFYDSAGNKTREEFTSTGKSMRCTYNGAHQLTRQEPGPGLQAPTTTYEYDSNGNMIKIKSQNKFVTPVDKSEHLAQFNALNRLIAEATSIEIASPTPAPTPSSSPSVSTLSSGTFFNYDDNDELFFSEAIKPTTYPERPYSADFSCTFHGYESGALLYINVTSGHLLAQDNTPEEETLAYTGEFYTYLNGLKVGITPMVDQPESFPSFSSTARNSGEKDSSVGAKAVAPPEPISIISYFCVYDGQGNIVQISNRVGGIPYELYTYSTYGLRSPYEKGTITNPNAAGIKQGASYKGYNEGPFGYKTGVRHYAPGAGRFMSPDAFKGYLHDPASQHPYMYCKGNPVKYSDPSGYDARIYEKEDKVVIKVRMRFTGDTSKAEEWRSEQESYWNTLNYNGKPIRFSISFPSEGEDLSNFDPITVRSMDRNSGKDNMTVAGWDINSSFEDRLHEMGHFVGGLGDTYPPDWRTDRYYLKEGRFKPKEGVMYTNCSGARFLPQDITNIVTGRNRR